ncbi:MAG: ribonuclease E [Desulfobulbaceae bacterium S5133MH15]|nr:MAG: ribonuclease E [Desulfobulbaceae bacterium S5133MH15]
MVQEKEKETEKGKRPLKIKAKIGAWWKSTVLPEKESVEENVSDILPEQEDGAEARKPSRRRTKKTPRKRQVQKKPPVKSSEAPGEEEGVTETEKKVPKGQKTRGKRPRNRSGQEKEKKTGEKDSPVSVQSDSVKEDVDTKGETSEPESKEQSSKGREPSKKKEAPRPKPVRKLLINAEEPEECRIALLENGRLESIHVSSVTRTRTKNNIYKAKIVAIEPSLQAAFVDYGTEKNGFLPFSEIHPEYYKEDLSDRARELVEAQHWKKLNIADVVEKGQEILAQVVKEEVGKKGANMTTYLSLPGRCVVLMPGSDSSGISRKISGEEKRSRLREAMKSTDIPEGIGWIVRTASLDITKTALSRDVGYLLRLWEETKKKGQSLEGVGLVYEDHHNVLMFLREHFDPSIVEILVDDRVAMDQVNEFIGLLPSKQKNVKVRLHRGSRPIFNQFSVEDQIESIYQPQVNLPSGGSIVINPTEALVAIDVNSGSTSKGKNFEKSIFQANMEAAGELARQLRLRDLGGLIVVDFIDMRSRKNIQAVEREVKGAMKLDKAKVDFSRISKFGLMEISRQKLGAPIEAGNYRRCEHCNGRGSVRSIETLALFYLRRIQTGASRKPVNRIECKFPLDVASYLLNNKREELTIMEAKYEVEIAIIAETTMKPADNNIVFHRKEKDVKQ